MTTSRPEDYIVYEFADQFMDDREAGRQKSLGEYLERFPGHDAAIAREYLALVAGPERSDGAVRATPVGGQRIRQYELQRELGRGGQAVVHLAIDTKLERPVALKLLKHTAARLDTAQIRRLEREAQVIARLDHPGICPVYEADFEGDTPFLAMRYLTGETVEARLAAARTLGPAHGSGELLAGMPRTTAEVHRVLLLIERVARTLHAAHEIGVIHRDVKPGNIMLDADGAPILLDFGLARIEGADSMTVTAPGEVYGTLYYMSPEQMLRATADLDRRTDVYSLGVTLFECLTLRRPFDAETREALFQSIVRGEPRDASELNPSLPHDVLVVLETAMERDVSRRYATALELAEDLARIRGFEPIRARPVGAMLRLRRWVQRHPALSASLALLSLGLAGTTFGFLRADHERDKAVIAQRDAERQRERFEAMLEHFNALALGFKLERAREAEAALYPAWPERIPAIDAWLDAHAAPLVAALPRLRESVALLGGGETALPGFGDAEDFLRANLPRLIADIEAFAGDGGPVERVRERRAWASEVKLMSIDAWERQWQETIADIERADGELTSERYRGLRITPQLGLVPLGPDPRSRLHEFYHLRSATDPTAVPPRGLDGRFTVHEDSGVVLVLLPGGRFSMGTQKDDESAPNHDPHSQSEEQRYERSVEPFFLSKYELTQKQWERLSRGANPSRFAYDGGNASRNPSTHYSPVRAHNPVENVSWSMCRDLLGRDALRLPSEEEWEYACRAGTGSPWSSGVKRVSLHGHANIADKTAGAHTTWNVDAMIEDGFVFHAPVGSFAPNAFGLHDMHGNVAEWVDEVVESMFLVRREIMTDGERMHRGGSYSDIAFDVRSGRRQFLAPVFRDSNVGVRPARTLMR